MTAVLWGSGGKLVPLGTVGTDRCPRCDEDSVFALSVVRKRLTIDFIPVALWKGDYYLWCLNCSASQVVDKPFAKQMHRELEHAFRSERSTDSAGALARAVVLRRFGKTDLPFADVLPRGWVSGTYECSKCGSPTQFFDRACPKCRRAITSSGAPPREHMPHARPAPDVRAYAFDDHHTGAAQPRRSWQADPTGRHEMRYWDGARWTANVTDGGARGWDPIT
jgi:hypothetical protein